MASVASGQAWPSSPTPARTLPAVYRCPCLPGRLRRPRPPGPWLNVGELGATGVDAAVAAAVHDAVGVRVRDLPILPWKVLAG
jgi:hypothetical protein